MSTTIMGSRHITIMWVLTSCLTLLETTLATPLRPTFSSCLNSYSPQAPESARLVVSDVLANIVPADEAREEGLQGNGVQVLRINLIGEAGSELIGYDNATNKLATLFIDAKTASFNVYQSTSWVCNSLFPSELPGPYIPQNTTYCPLPAGPFGLNISIPLYRSYALTTLRTQIRIVDTSETAQTLSCLDIQFTPYYKGGWYYGMFLWLPVALAIGFFVTTWGARSAAGWVVGSGVAEYEQKETALGRRARLDTAKKEATMRKWGTMIISGLSGERLSVSGGLLRFVTPGLKEILHHVQFCAMLGMIAVSWPRFAYPILSQGAWATLVWNTTLVQGADADSKRVNPYPNPSNYTVPAEFADQISNPDLPLYLDESAFNPLFNLYNQPRGMESFAFAVGLRPQDLFGTCLVIFLILVLAVILISLALWASHCLLEYSTTPTNAKQQQLQQQQLAASRSSLGTSPMPSYATKNTNEARTPSLWDTPAPPSLPAQHSVPPRSTGPSHARRIWWRFRPKGEAGAFHAAALYGNLLRLILIFHLPITIFSIYQLVLGSRASIVSRVFAALAFAFISVLIPTGIMLKIKRTPSGKLFDATRTLLSLGPMYNVYVEDKQMYRAIPLGASLVAGIVVGAGQKSGLAQAIILVLVELVLLIAPAIWYPWDVGASMGAPHTFVAALRTISMVLVMLLSPELSMTAFTSQWLTYAILLLQAIIFVFFLLMLITKAVEGFIRLFGGVHFDESTHPLDGGLFGAIADLDCLNPRGGKAAERKRRKRGSKQLQRNVSAAGSLTTQMMLDRHSMGVMRPVSDGVGGGNTPFLSPNNARRPTPGVGPHSANYFPAYTPPLGPPPMERHSSDSMTDEQHAGGNIMDAWRPYHSAQAQGQGGYFEMQQAQAQSQGVYGVSSTHGRSQSTPNAYGPMPLQSSQSPPFTGIAAPGPSGPGGFSVLRGGRADITNPYTVQNPSTFSPGEGRDRSATMSPPPSIRVSPISPKPTHSRQHSSSAIIESFDQRPSPPATPLHPPHPPVGIAMGMGTRRQSSGLQPNHQGLTPPVLAIPKRRSLNNLREDSPTDQSVHDKELDAAVAGKKKKRRSWFKSDPNPDSDSPVPDDEDYTEESDDEPGPSRRKSKSKSKPKSKPKPKPKPKQRASIPLKQPAPFEPVPLVLDYDPSEDDIREFQAQQARAQAQAQAQLSGTGDFGPTPNSGPALGSASRSSRSTATARAGHAPGLLGFLGLRRKKSLDDVAEQARDENSARKAVLAAESGAMLFGVTPSLSVRSSSPTSASASAQGRSFKVSRANPGGVRGSPLSLPTNKTNAYPPTPAPALALAQGQGQGSSTNRPVSGSGSGTGAGGVPAPSPRSFKVKRANQAQTTPHPRPSPLSPLSTPPIQPFSGYNEFGQPTLPSGASAAASPNEEGAASTKSFKVKRPPNPHAPASGASSAASSFIVNRPQAPPVLSAPITSPSPPQSPRPESPHTASNRGKASMFQSTKGA